MNDDTIYHFSRVEVQILKENKKSVFIPEKGTQVISCVLPFETVGENNSSELVQKRLMSVLGLYRKSGKFRVRILKLEGCTQLLSAQQKWDRGISPIVYNTRYDI